MRPGEVKRWGGQNTGTLVAWLGALIVPDKIPTTQLLLSLSFFPGNGRECLRHSGQCACRDVSVHVRRCRRF